MRAHHSGAAMRFVSSAGGEREADLETAVLRGLAPDGGLYVPCRLDPLPAPVLADFRGRPLPRTAPLLARHLLADALAAPVVDEIVRAALDFPIPLVRLDERTFVLELFHGPTLAFKDVGARFLARLLVHYRERAATDGRPAPEVTVLAATSGDTGAAVAHAFHALAGVRVFILFPAGQVSPRQERMFTTLGGNVHALAVTGSFDDCQRLVKQALADEALQRDRILTGANSINVGRLLPQIFYYFHAWAQLPEAAGRQPVVVSVPSGNFGNLAAGLMAKRLGLPVARFIAATNVNDVVPRYLATGRFEPRPSVRTLSNAMDVGNPSNLARIVHLYGGDVARIREDVAAYSHSDEETRRCIARVFQSHSYILDPHTAVGYLALEAELARRPGGTAVLLATAHPAKFADVLEPLIGQPLPVPEPLAACLAGEPRKSPLEPELGALRRVVLEAEEAGG